MNDTERGQYANWRRRVVELRQRMQEGTEEVEGYVATREEGRR